MWRLVSVPCVLTLLAAFPASGSAQAGEETETSEPSLQERVSEPAPEEPALELKLDDAGVQVTPTEESQQTKQRSRGAKAGIAVGVIVGVGLVGFGIGAAVAISNWEFKL